MSESTPAPDGLQELPVDTDLRYSKVLDITRDTEKRGLQSDKHFANRKARYWDLLRAFRTDAVNTGIKETDAKRGTAILLAGMNTQDREIFEHGVQPKAVPLSKNAITLANEIEAEHKQDPGFSLRVARYSSLLKLIQDEVYANHITQDDADNQVAILLAGMDPQARDSIEK